MKSSRNDLGFTLIELLVGIAVSSLLLVALFQLLSDLTTLRESFRRRSHNSHQRTALNRLLTQDLLGSPVKKSDFRGATKEFYRTVPTYDTEQNMTLETRVHYYVRSTGPKQELHREIKWMDLTEKYHSDKHLLTANSIKFSYLPKDGAWRGRTGGEESTTIALRISWDDTSLTFPVAPSKDDL